MKTQNIILLVLLVGCCVISAQTTNNQTSAIGKPKATASSEEKLPTWYVFKIKAFRKVTYSDDRTSAIVEGVTIKDKEFKVKMVWDPAFDGAHQKALDQWLKKSKEQFEEGIPYVIAGKVLSRDPLTVQPDTMAPHAPNFGAPPKNVY